ncbi:chalcone isomerase family protein [Pseudomonas sp. ABY48]|uniref:chalcone isomerase family protein n=1 Tax=Pseudomonas sp. ABY48 TaxID=3402865 RepID=UPI003B42F883
MAPSFALRKCLLAIALCLPTLYCAQALSDWRGVLPGTRLVGQADFHWYGFDLYQARLWSAAAAPSLETAFALELNYRRAIGKESLVETSLKEMQRLNGTPLDAKRRDEWAAQMRRAFIDVKPGSRITGLYQPGQGCRFYVGETLSLAVADPLFARAFFAIWLDPRTREPDLRNQLLGIQTSSDGRNNQ